jgi:hypothetical protein
MKISSQELVAVGKDMFTEHIRQYIPYTVSRNPRQMTSKN